MRASPLSLRFYFESAVALSGLALTFVTLIWNEWIELVFRVDPDAGNGSAEILVCIGLLAIAAVSSWLARTEWRQTRALATHKVR
jgi:hypothetical protein